MDKKDSLQKFLCFKCDDSRPCVVQYSSKWLDALPPSICPFVPDVTPNYERCNHV